MGSSKVHSTIIFLLTFISLVFGAALRPEDVPTGLYSLNDDVEILTADNLKESVYNSNRAWLVEFYSSWCGHCQRFAPTWKEFATDIKAWKDVIVVAAVDCADELNNPLCMQFNITRYPVVKYFHDKYEESPDNLGSFLSHGYSVHDLREDLINVLMVDQAKRADTSFPNLQPYTGEYSDIFSSVPGSQQICVLIFQEPSDTVGPEMILDFHKVPELCVKFAYRNNTKLVSRLEPKVFPSMYLIERNNLNSPEVLTVFSPDRKGLAETMHRVLVLKNINFPEEVTLNSTTASSIIHIVIKIPDVKRSDTNVFQMDLESALRYSLKQEIGLLAFIGGEKLEALRKYLAVIEKYFPLGPDGKVLLHRIREYANSTMVSGREISGKVKEGEKNKAFSSPQNWVGCKGSTSFYRGYPCGVWKMFHYLTVNAALQDSSNADVDPKVVLGAMHAYITNFFGCLECVNHFREMTARRKVFEVKSWDESILFLWKAHNEVNRRLAGDPSEDPQHPKIQFPSMEQCPSCFNNDGSYNDIEALKFLKDMYSKNNIKYDGADVTVLNLGAVSSRPKKCSPSRYPRQNKLLQTEPTPLPKLVRVHI